MKQRGTYVCFILTINLSGGCYFAHVAKKGPCVSPSSHSKEQKGLSSFISQCSLPSLVLPYSHLSSVSPVHWAFIFLSLSFCSKCSLCLSIQFKYPFIRQGRLPWALRPGKPVIGQALNNVCCSLFIREHWITVKSLGAGPAGHPRGGVGGCGGVLWHSARRTARWWAERLQCASPQQNNKQLQADGDTSGKAKHHREGAAKIPQSSQPEGGGRGKAR